MPQKSPPPSLSSSSSSKSAAQGPSRPAYEVAMFHPDLGIGGAERLVLDIASSLQSRGHHVTLYTSYFDPNRCFQDARDGSIDVYPHFQWIPRHLFGRFHIFFATFRMFLLSIFTMFLFVIGKRPSPDVVIVDQVSLPNLLFRLAGYKVVFYCHFPDLCLASHEGSLLKWYRLLFDWLEERTTGLAHHICVNSRFTEKRFRSVFPSLVGFKEVTVVNPTFQPPPRDDEVLRKGIEELREMGVTKDKIVVLSINRFERKKNVSLLLESMKQMRENGVSLDPKSMSIVMAGGFDDRIPENVGYLEELKKMAGDYDLAELCLFLPSCSDEIKNALLHIATVLVYTPVDEHFGIVPLEGMAAGVPVIATNTGGPLETVVDGETGRLMEPTSDAFADAIADICMHKRTRNRMGRNAKKRVTEMFSLEAMGERVEGVLDAITSTKRR
eukprot:TRINITY_DN24886_c0_g1_i1.p1 TRINITY_DN24886_c0_g1~~TRINITY_DN24886_c0_g1_i1.p1  ORF type:complete len:465 (+),score=122.39 TRINITY_DN24886_c0_g1_i1:73-1395(+)